MAGIRGTGRNRKELWRWQTPVLPGLYRHKAEGNQRGDDPCQRPVYEPAEEAKASFAPLFQVALEFDSKPAGREDFFSRLKNGICAGNTIINTFLDQQSK